MTDSNIQPPDTTNDQTVNIDSTNAYHPPTDDGTIGLSDPNQDVVITTGTAADTYNVDPNIDYAGAVDFHVDNMQSAPADPRIDHVLEHLHNLESKIDQLICDCNHHKEPPVYEGHVVLHATSQPPV